MDVLLVFILNSVGLVEELWGTLTADSAQFCQWKNYKQASKQISGSVCASHCWESIPSGKSLLSILVFSLLDDFSDRCCGCHSVLPFLFLGSSYGLWMWMWSKLLAPFKWVASLLVLPYCWRFSNGLLIGSCLLVAAGDVACCSSSSSNESIAGLSLCSKAFLIFSSALSVPNGVLLVLPKVKSPMCCLIKGAGGQHLLFDHRGCGTALAVCRH